MTENKQLISVFTQPQPFSDHRVDAVVPPGGSVAACLLATGLDLPEHVSAHVFVDDAYIERSRWDKVYPGAGQIISVKVVPAGGSAGKNVLRVVAMIGVVALSYVTYGQSLNALGPLMAGMAGSAVGIAGSLAVNALIPPVEQSLSSSDLTGVGGSSAYSLSGVRNAADPYGSVTALFGKHKIYPKLAALPYTENYDSDSYLRMLFLIGYGEYDLTDYKIGATSLSSFADYEISAGDKDAISDLYPNDVYEDALSVEVLNSGGWYEQTSQASTTELSVDLTFPAGLWKQTDAGHIRAGYVNVEVEYSVKDAGSWTDFPDSPVKISRKSFERFSYGFRKADLAANEYDVRVRKTSGDYDSNNPQPGTEAGAWSVYWTALRSFNYQAPVTLDGITLVALRIKATGQLNGVIDQFNCIATRKVPAWDGSAWTANAATQNPAWAYAEVLRGSANHNAIADSAIDGDGLKDWADACTSAGYKFDAIIDRKTTIFELLRKIASAGRASFGIIDNEYTVVRDITKSTPVQHFSPRNSWGFRGSKVFSDVPHALRCRFINADSNYQQDEVIVYDDGYDANNATRFETMDFFGVTDADHIWKLARYYIACARLRPEKFEVNTDIEHIVCTRGDLVRLTHDVLLVGLGQARIKSVSGSNVTIDSPLVMSSGKSYGAQVRKSDGTMLDASVSTAAGEQTTITLSSTSGAAKGDLIFFGEYGSESIDCLVTRILPGPNLTAKITMVNDAPAVRTADSGTIPTYDPNITKPPEVNRVPPTPTIESITLVMTPVVVTDATINQLQCQVNFSVGIATDIMPSNFQAQYRDLDTESPPNYSNWHTVPDVDADVRSIRIPVEDGVTYDFRVRSVSQFGATSDWDTYSNYLVAYNPTVPNDISGLALVQGGSAWSGLDCEITWTAATDTWRIKKYQIKVYKTSPLALLRTEYVDRDQNTYSYSFAENTEDNSGTPIGGLTFRLVAISINDEPSDSYASLAVTHSSPSAVTSLAGTAWAGGVEFDWDENTDEAFSHFEFREKVGAALNGEPWYRIQNPQRLRMLTSAEKDTYGADATIYFEVKAVDKFGAESAVSSTSKAASSLNIKVTDIDDFAITASKLFTKIPILTGDNWTDNSPNTDSVAWNEHTLVFNGASYTITAGNTDKKYIYWDLNSSPTTYHGTDTHPGASILDDEAFIIATNIDGEHDMAWNAIANEVIGSAFIQTAAINDAHINNLSASKITTGTLDADRIGANSILIGQLGSSATDLMFSSSTRDFSDVGGSTKPADNADVTEDQFSNSLSTIDTQVNRAELGFDSNGNIITSVIPASSVTPSGAGLYLGANYMGYFDASVWKTYMDNQGKFYLGGTSGKLQWNGSTLSINGNVTITGGSGITNLTDAGGLATEDSADWSTQVSGSNKPANNADVTGDQFANSLSTIDSQVNRAELGFDANGNIITSVLPAANVTPSGPGLYLGANYLGYHDASTWKTYMDNQGKFYLGGPSGKLQWNGSTLSINGNVTITGGTGISNFSDAGGLATEDSADWSTQVSGTGKPASNADVTDYDDYRVSNRLSDESVTTIARPEGAAYSGGSNDTGAIVVTLPQSWTSTMLKFEIDVFNYIAASSFTAKVGGYTYTGTTQWIYEFAQIIGNTEGSNRVRFGHDGSKCCVVIGETTDTWQYLKIAVKDLQAGQNVYGVSDWEDGWTVGTVDDLSGYTFTGDFSDALLDAKAIIDQGALATEDDLDGVPDGSSYKRVAATYISSGKVVVAGDTGNHVVLDGANGKIYINSSTYGADGIQLDYNSGNPRFYCGDGSDDFFKYDGTNVELSTSKSNGLLIKNGGGIKLEAGGDLKLARSSTNVSQMLFYDSSDTLVAKMYHNNASLVLVAYESSKVGSVIINKDNITLSAKGDPSDSYACRIVCTDGGGNIAGLDIDFQNYAPNSTSSMFIRCQDYSSTRMLVYGNGNIVNDNNSYGAYSDGDLKENVRDCTPKLDDLLNVKVRNFNFKGSDPIKDKHIGVVSQEIAEVFPGLVYTGEGGYQVVQYSLFVPMLIKALQELTLKVEKINERTTENDDRRSSDGGGANAVAHYDA